MKRTPTIAAALVLATIAPAVGACSKSTVSDETGATLALVAPPDQAVAPGETCTLKLSIRRKGIEGPVAIHFDGLPRGVSIVESRPEIPAGNETATVTLHADNEVAAVGDHTVTVTAAAQSGMSVSERFHIELVAAK
jgi:hypothetical protein